MTKELLPGLLAVEVPEDKIPSYFIETQVTGQQGLRYTYGTDWIYLPPGTWSIVGGGTADKISEQEWAMVVESVYYSGEIRFINYSNPKEPFLYTSVASGLSLLKSHNLNPSKTVILTKNI